MIKKGRNTKVFTKLNIEMETHNTIAQSNIKIEIRMKNKNNIFYLNAVMFCNRKKCFIGNVIRDIFLIFLCRSFQIWNGYRRF